MPVVRSKESGFSLLEALIALTVFAVCATGFLSAVQTHLGRVRSLELRMLSAIAAENELARQIGEVPAMMQESMLGYDLNLRVVANPLAETRLKRIEISVRQGQDDMPLADLTGFVEVAAGP